MATNKHKHAQFSGWKFFTKPQIEQRFGETVTKLIPSHPEYVTLRDIAETSEIIVSRFGCGCYGNLTDHEEAKRLRTVEATELYNVSEKSRMSGQERLDDLLAAVRAGKDVDPLDITTAREQVVIDRINAEVAEEKARVEQFEADVEAGRQQFELTESYGIELAASSADLRTKATDAAKAIAVLLDAAKEHRQLAQTIALHLEHVGIDPKHTVQHLTESIVIGTTQHEYWQPQYWSAAVLGAVARRYQLMTGSKWNRAELPKTVRGGPVISVPVPAESK